MAGPIGLQQLLRMQGLEWGDSANGDKHLWIDGSLNFDGPLLLSGVPTNGLTTQLEVDDSSGNQIFVVRPNIPSSPGAAFNTVYISGQMPTLMTAAVDSYVFHVRGSGQGASALAGQTVARFHFKDTTDSPYLTNYTGTKLTAAVNGESAAQGTGTTPVQTFVGNTALVGLSTGATAGWNIGMMARARLSTGANIGVLGQATNSAAGEVWNIGVLGVARQAAQISNSGYFLAGIVEPVVGLSSVVTVDSGTTAVNLLVGVQNGGTRVIWDSKGNMTYTPSATAAGATLMSMTPGAHTAVVAEVIDYNYAAHTITITGGYATQRFAVFAQPSISAGSALTVVTAATVAIAGPPIAAGSALITVPLALSIASGMSAFGGAVIQSHATAAINSTNTATAAQAATGYITSTSAAPTTITLPTGTALGAVLGAGQGTIFELTIDNTAGSSTVTVAVNTNAILSAEAAAVAASAGLLTIPSGVTGQGTFKLMFSSATAYTFTRIA